MKHIHLAGPLLGTFAFLAGCNGGGGHHAADTNASGLEPLDLSQVETETRTAAGSTIGPAGGTIATTGSNGVTYTLTIPPLALTGDTEIAMYPARSLKGLPAGSDIRAGVHLVPEGLRLLEIATLTMDFPAGTDPGRLVGLAYAGDGERIGLYPEVVEGQRVTVRLIHFSGYDVMLSNFEALVQTPDGSDFSVRILHALEAATATARDLGTDPGPDYLRLLHEWYLGSVKPLVLKFGSTADGLAFLALDDKALWGETDLWQMAILVCRLFRFDPDSFPNSPIPDEIELADLIGQGISHNLPLLADLCKSDLAGGAPIGRALLLAHDMLFLQHKAAVHQVESTAAGTDLPSVVRLIEGCLHPEFEDIGLRENMLPGDTDLLGVVAGVRIPGGALIQTDTLAVHIRQDSLPFGSPPDGRTGVTGAFGSRVTFPRTLTILDIEVRLSLGIPDFPDVVSLSKHLQRPPNPFAGTYFGFGRGTVVATEGSTSERSEFLMVVNSDGTLVASGTVTRNQDVHFTATGTVSRDGDAFVAATAGSGQAACPFTFNGSFQLNPPDKDGSGTYSSDCGGGLTSSGTWACSTRPPDPDN